MPKYLITYGINLFKTYYKLKTIMKKTKPIKVYLDNQDYSKFCTSTDLKIKKIKETLLNYIKDKKIEIFFSDINVMEALPHDSNSLKYGTQRVKCIKELSRKSFPSFVTIFEKNVYFYLKKIDKNYSFNAEKIKLIMGADNWASSYIEEDEIIFSDSLIEWLNDWDALCKKYGKIKTRKLMKPLEINNKIKVFCNEIMNQNPILSKDRKTVMDFLEKRNGNTKRLIHAIKNGISDIDFYCEWVLKDFKNRSCLIKTYRDESIQCTKILKNLYKLKELDDYDQENLLICIENKKIQSKTESLIKIHPNIMEPFLVEKTFCEKEFNQICLNLFIMIEVKYELAKRVSVKEKALNPDNKGRNGDHLDSLQACYAPLVDIFRCDGGAADILKQITKNKKFSTVICGKLEDLIPEIKKKLNEN